MNIIARLEFELAYYDSAVHRFNHYASRTPPIISRVTSCHIGPIYMETAYISVAFLRNVSIDFFANSTLSIKVNTFCHIKIYSLTNLVSCFRIISGKPTLCLSLCLCLSLPRKKDLADVQNQRQKHLLYVKNSHWEWSHYLLKTIKYNRNAL